ncbi:MAG: serine hydrolase domain-containing protein [Pseudomonadales bacterium]
MRWLILAFAAIPVMAIWATVVFVGTAGGWWRSALADDDDSEGFAAAVVDRLERDQPGDAAFRLLADGEVVAEHYVSRSGSVTADTRFQVASVSKWLTAWGVMTLVESGSVDLDAPVTGYLRRWQLPPSEFDDAVSGNDAVSGIDAVTVRRLLSHTAGLTDGLGYQGFAPGTPVQSLVGSLTRAADAMPGADGRARVGLEPGGQWLYSGASYALLQLLIEDVTGSDFADYLQRAVLTPLGMDRSTFLQQPSALTDLATAYDTDASPAPYQRFAAPAAAGLYTSAADLTRFLQAQRAGPQSEPAGRGVLRPDTLARMREPQATLMGTDLWGLGHMLYADNGSGGHIIGHDGGNRPAINTTVRVDPDSGDAIIVLVTGNPDLASELGGEWVFWRTGRLDVGSYSSAVGNVVVLIGVGWIVIACAFFIIGWRVTRPHPEE